MNRTFLTSFLLVNSSSENMPVHSHLHVCSRFLETDLPNWKADFFFNSSSIKLVSKNKGAIQIEGYTYTKYQKSEMLQNVKLSTGISKTLLGFLSVYYLD